ncbi:MAG TPA: transcriptional regulator [Gammaproteobacteria bacterium]
MDIKPIRTKSDYRGALKKIETLMSTERNTPDGDRLDVLVTLVEAYERTHFPMDLPDAVEAIKFRMEQSGLTVEDLEPVIGRKNRVYEVLSRRRRLTLRMIEGLHAKFGIPAESLLKQQSSRSQAKSARGRARKA